MVGVTKRVTLFDIFNMLLLSLIALTTLYPFVYLLTISLSPMEEILKSDFILFPRVITFASYDYVFKTTGIGNSYLVTIYIAIMGTLVNLFMSCLGGYVLANKQLPGRNFFTSIVVVTMLFSGGLIPNYLVVKGLGMFDSLWALIIPGAVNTFWMIVLRNFFQSIPDSLAESARMDGCSEFRILLQIVLPLSTPVLATLALFYGVSHWNTYFAAIIYLNDQDKMPLQVLIRSMYQLAIEDMDENSLPPPVETIRAATIMAATLPILCVYPFLQKYFVKGMMVGALKG